MSLGRFFLALAVCVAPFVFMGWIALRRKQKHRAEACMPFTSNRLRPAGESLRLKIEAISEDMDTEVTMLAMVVFGVALLVGFVPAFQSITVMIGIGLVWLFAYVRFGRKFFPAQKELWAYRLGFEGERVVGEALTPLIADGFRVFHDLPFEGFNIDHVVVGPHGVVAVETKTIRKRSHIQGNERARVIYDGTILKFPHWTGRKELKQAQRNAETLSKWLSGATGEQTPVQAWLVLPGWYVEQTGDAKRAPVRVLNEKMVVYAFPEAQRFTLSPERMKRIVYQLEQRCRLPDEPEVPDASATATQASATGRTEPVTRG